MRIYEKYQQIKECENINFDSGWFFYETSMKNIKKSKMSKIDHDEYLK